MAINLIEPIQIAKPISNLDSFYGPYESINQAKTTLSALNLLRPNSIGRRIGIITNPTDSLSIVIDYVYAKVGVNQYDFVKTSPYIDPTSKNWIIDTVDSGICSLGPKGDTGATGAAGADGAKGEKGESGDNGLSFITSYIFIRSISLPTTPTTGSFTNLAPYGWSDGIPTGTDPIWSSHRTFCSDATYNDTAWSTPVKMADTADFDVAYHKAFTDNATPTAYLYPNTHFQEDLGNGWTNTASSDTIWMATDHKINGEWLGWHVFKVKGEDGTNGDSSIYFVTVYKSGSSVSAPASTEGSYNFTNHTINAPSGWQKDLTGLTAPIWETHKHFYADSSITVESWSTPTRVIVNASELLDESDLIKVNSCTIYKQSQNTPNAPTFSSADLGMGEDKWSDEQIPTPTLPTNNDGWSLSVPTTIEKIWMSSITFHSDGTNTGWTGPFEYSGIGDAIAIKGVNVNNVTYIKGKDYIYNESNVLIPYKELVAIGCGTDGETVFYTDGHGLLAGGLIRWGKYLYDENGLIIYDTNNKPVDTTKKYSIDTTVTPNTYTEDAENGSTLTTKPFGLYVKGVINAEAGKIGGWTIASDYLYIKGSDGKILLLHPSQGLKSYSQNENTTETIYWQLSPDGSASFAQNKILFGADGSMQISPDGTLNKGIYFDEGELKFGSDVKISWLTNIEDKPEVINGTNGKSYEGTSEYYWATESIKTFEDSEKITITDNGINIPTSTWSLGSDSNFSASKPYLYNCEVITSKKDDVTSYEVTCPQLVANWSKDGKTVKYIAEYYVATGGITTPSSYIISTDASLIYKGITNSDNTYTAPGYTDVSEETEVTYSAATNSSLANFNNSNPYLWNVEVLFDEDGHYLSNTGWQLISHWGQDGNAKGVDFYYHTAIDGGGSPAILVANNEGTENNPNYVIPDNLNGWHSTFSLNDVWMCTFSVATGFGTPMKVVGENGTNGAYYDYKFARSSLNTSTGINTAPNSIDTTIDDDTEEGDTNDGWNDKPIAVTTDYPYLWMKMTYIDENGSQSTSSYICMTGKDGNEGKSAYECYVANGGDKNLELWLNSLIGASGKSAYEIAVQNGYNGTLSEWVASLDGAPGLSAYDVYVAQCTGEGETALSKTDWLNSLKGSVGKSAYECYKDGVTEGTPLSELEWLASLIGNEGKSAYEVYLATTEDNPKKSETEWLESLDGTDGLSAYDIYLALVPEGETALTEEEWLESLNGESATLYYIHYVYCSNTTTGADYSTTETNDYMGTYVDTEQEDASTFDIANAKISGTDGCISGIVWSKIKGEKGDASTVPGPKGKSVKLVETFYEAIVWSSEEFEVEAKYDDVYTIDDQDNPTQIISGWSSTIPYTTVQYALDHASDGWQYKVYTYSRTTFDDLSTEVSLIVYDEYSSKFGSKLTYIGSDGIYTGQISADLINSLELTTSKGTIGGWSISSNSIYTGTLCLLGSDGSGYFAGGNIAWDKAGIINFGKYTEEDDTNYYTTIGTDGILNTSNIIATGGTIGGWSLSENAISNGYVADDKTTRFYTTLSAGGIQIKKAIGSIYNLIDFRPDTGISISTKNGINTKQYSKFNMDGSGWLANLNIAWDKDGIISIGKYTDPDDSNNILYYTTIDSDGVLETSNITAAGGSIGGWNITSDSIYGGDEVTLPYGCSGNSFSAGKLTLYSNGTIIGSKSEPAIVGLKDYSSNPMLSALISRGFTAAAQSSIEVRPGELRLVSSAPINNGALCGFDEVTILIDGYGIRKFNKKDPVLDSNSEDYNSDEDAPINSISWDDFFTKLESIQ